MRTVVILAAVALVLPGGASGQASQEVDSSVRAGQQTQSEVPEDWAERAGICRRTVEGCEGRSTTATRLGPGQGIEVDGQLDEDVWRRATWITDFIQIEPIEGARPTVRTEIAFAYDDGTLYVAGRMYDPEPSRIRANLARRDRTGESDRLTISIDSYLDRRTSYTFTVTAAGGRVDYFSPTDDPLDRDRSYDPVWSAESRITERGWFAEMEIPLSQLRFNQAEEITFGVNVNRYMPARDQDLFWAPVPQDEDGWASWFGDLEGLRGIDSHRPVELVPYFGSELGVTSEELLDADDPFAERSDLGARVGADLKMGIGSGLTLDATFNPDFGQVEADPAEVNLSAFPTFFDERRQFFVENADLLEANGLFFSRHIGEAPHGSTPGRFADVPEATTILGAAKLTGRTAGGLSVGALTAVTAEESAEFYDPEEDAFGRTRVEPAAGWLVLRGLQELGTANNTLGLAFTGVRRDLSAGDPLAAELNREAYAGGADLQLQFDGGLTQLVVDVQGSHITGTPDAIARVQRFSSHYFQRPDAEHVAFEPARTSMTGYRASLELDRRDGDHWLFEADATATSPEFDINDAGALDRADRIETEVELVYTENRVGTFRNWNAAAEVESEWNYDGDRLSTVFEGRASFGLRNYWGFGAELDFEPGALSDTRTRGGPLMGTPTKIEGQLFFNSDSRERLQGNGFLYYENDDIGGRVVLTRLGLQYQPGGAWRFSFSPEYARIVDARQYVTTLDGGRAATFGRRYVFGRIDRHSLSTRVRADYALTPELSLEGYFEPFVATGRYSDFGELREPGSTALRLYGTDGTTLSESEGAAPRTITVQDGADQFSFIREDFRSLSFRSNLVLRWEWTPGSTLFLVWQLDRGGFDLENGPDEAGLGDLLDTPGEPGRNFVAVKATYWMPI